ncbi:AraC family transcriptional regulator [Actinomycetospora sp. NBRC 106375]|uniref:AraC family transcriptional regulator n=1 Tax=Actinomycetospora sp. NBRC 106375 TaxID=3032207 RepID=UPI0024A2664B|nr:AraC family transcriptional regulator [Actinomycetospora sp. NBRC 106375]GLZ50365.1 AraC family transcriptional regulator [Actinomycetospora sp. NBRC 106375]
MQDSEERRPIDVLEAFDLAGAHTHIASVYIPHRLIPHDRAAPSFRMAHLQTPRLTLGHVRYGADIELACPAMESFLHLNLTLAGSTQVRQGKSTAETSAGVAGAAFNADEPYRVRWSPDAVQYALKVSRRSIDEQLAALLGQQASTAEFDLTFDLAGTTGRSLLAAVHHLGQQFGAFSASGGVPRLVQAQLDSYILTQILLAVPNSHSELLRSEPACAGRSHIRRAAELLERRAGEPWTIEQLARAVSVSARALHNGFRKELETTPIQYLHEIRLQRVRDELLIGEATQVSDVAVKWGFYHLGRFSQQYRRRFGVLPSETLRQNTS